MHEMFRLSVCSVFNPILAVSLSFNEKSLYYENRGRIFI